MRQQSGASTTIFCFDRDRSLLDYHHTRPWHDEYSRRSPAAIVESPMLNVRNFDDVLRFKKCARPSFRGLPSSYIQHWASPIYHVSSCHHGFHTDGPNILRAQHHSDMPRAESTTTDARTWSRLYYQQVANARLSSAAVDALRSNGPCGQLETRELEESELDLCACFEKTGEDGVYGGGWEVECELLIQWIPA